MSHDSVVSDALTDLGLSASPFTPGDSASADFISPLRENQVQRAAHLCRYGDQLLVVVGGRGAGKSFFLTKLALDLAEEPQLIEMDAAIYKDSESRFWPDLLNQLTSPVDVADSLGAQIAAVRKYLAQCEEPPMLLMDNADTFSDQLLAVLMSLMSAGAGQPMIKVVFTGDTRLVERLDALNNIEVMVYDLELAVVTVEQWLNFCDIQLRLYGLSGDSPITEEVLEGIISDAGINVRKTFERLDDQLREVTVTSIPDKGSLGLPPMHLALIVGLVLFLLLVVLLGERLWGEDQSQTPPAFDKKSEVVVYDAALDESPASEIVEAALAVEQSSTDAAVAMASEPVKQEPPAQEAVTLAPIENAGSPSVVEKTEPAPVPAVQNAVPQTVPQDEDVKPAAAPSVAVNSPAEELVVEAPPTESTADDSFNLPDNRYVLQILAASKPTALREFVALQPNRDSLRIAKIKRGDGSWFVLLQGNYASPEAARSAVKSLPKAQQKDGVWPRKTDDIKRILFDN